MYFKADTIGGFVYYSEVCESDVHTPVAGTRPDPDYPSIGL